MKEFIKDLETFVIKHWRPMVIILGVIILLNYYPDIKSGIVDGWLNK
jgi:hypothetical protein